MTQHIDGVGEEYAALRATAILVDRSSRLRMRFEGAKAADVLTGLVTNDVLALAPGSGLYAVALTAKGKIIADVRIFRRAPEDFLVDTSPRAAEGWAALVRKYVNPRLARFADVSADLTDLGVFGVCATAIVASALGVDAASIEGLGDYAHFSASVDGVELTIARVPDLGVPGVEIFAPSASKPALWTRLRAAGAHVSSGAVWDVARIEAGRPEWGTDMDDTSLAQEANMDDLHAISYSKGCYTGQETVARLHFRGHVNKHLFGLRFESSMLPPHGAEVVGAEDNVIGTIRSAAASPRHGGVALAMLRRESAIGNTVTVRWENGTCAATISALPMRD